MVVSNSTGWNNCRRRESLSRAVNFVVSCTNRKRFEPTAETSIRGIEGEDLQSRLANWKRSLRRARMEEHCANDVYMGDHWSVVRSIPGIASRSGLSVRTWICSAGYGLIQPGTPIKAYRATFTRGEDDYIGAGLVEGEHRLPIWWRGVCSYRIPEPEFAPRSISALAEAYPRTPIIVALSAEYLSAVAEDLAGVIERHYFRDHLTIISCGTSKNSHQWGNNLLACDASMAASLGGALTSLNARIVRHLFQQIAGAEITAETLGQVAAGIDRGDGDRVASRKIQSDSEVAAFIGKQLATFPGKSRSKLLREFRDLGFACEQSRFGDLYSGVQRQKPRRTHG